MISAAALLFAGGLAYFIWRFNPVFKLPELNRQQSPTAITTLPTGDGPLLNEETEARLYINTPSDKGSGKRNILKAEGGVLVISPDSKDENPANDFKIIEKTFQGEDGKELSFEDNRTGISGNGDFTKKTT